MVLTLLGLPHMAEAATPREEIERGIRLREAGRDAEALEAFRAAYSASQSPRALAQIALAEQALGRWVDAEKHLVEALAGAPKSRWIRRYRSPLKGALVTIRERLGSLSVQVPGVRGAVVRVNGEAAGRSPLAEPVRVVAGTVVVEISAEGYWPMSRQIEVKAGTRARERFTLVERTEEAAPPPSVATAAPSGVSPPSGGATVSAVEPAVVGPSASLQASRTGGPDLTVPAFLAAGGAAAGVGVGVAFLLVRNGHVDNYNDDRCLDGERTRDENCGDELDAADDAELVMTAGFIGAGVLGVTAAILFLLDGPDAPPRADLGPGPGDLGASWVVRF